MGNGLNSMQAYQLSTAITPSFLSQLPPGSSQANALNMQYKTAQGDIYQEAQKKMLKKQADAANNPLNTALGFGEAALGAVNPIKSLVGDISGGLGGTIQGTPDPGFAPAGTVQVSPLSPVSMGGADATLDPATPGAPVAATSSSVLATPPSPDPSQPAASSESQYDPNATSGPTANPAVAGAALLGGAALLHAAGQNSQEAAAQQGAVNQALSHVSDPFQRTRIMNWAKAGPQDFANMRDDERLVAVSGLASAGIPLTKQQSRAIPAEERRMYQKQYGPSIIPMTFPDHLNHLIDSYEKSTGPGRLVRPYNGLEMYIP